MKQTLMIIIALAISLTIISGCKPEQKLIGGDKDEHGCLIAAGYSWCDAKQKCIRTWEENCTTEPSCACPQGYVQEGNVCNPQCYYNTPKCLMPSIQCSTQENTAIANPASVYCQQNGGTLHIITAADGSQSGQCTLSDGTVCDEWQYFRGECGETIHTCTEEEKAAEICTMEYIPVCGDDNITYGNKCSACASKKINSWTKGECQQIDQKQKCGECPQIIPPGPEFCKNGIIIAGETDTCGCQGAPTCQSN